MVHVEVPARRCSACSDVARQLKNSAVSTCDASHQVGKAERRPAMGAARVFCFAASHLAALKVDAQQPAETWQNLQTMMHTASCVCKALHPHIQAFRVQGWGHANAPWLCGKAEQ